MPWTPATGKAGEDVGRWGTLAPLGSCRGTIPQASVWVLLIWEAELGVPALSIRAPVRHRILFWTDWDASLPRIEAASMSGAGRRTIHKETGSGGWPNGLTVDYLEKRILWIDAR